MTKPAIKILYVEDNEGDILLLSEAIRESEVDHVLNVVRNGKEAIRFLNKENEYEDMSTPSLILLDINMPEMNGLEFLELVKTNEKFKQLPVIMFTTSSAKKDILEAYKRYANNYILKPSEVDELNLLVDSIRNYWFHLSVLPE